MPERFVDLVQLNNFCVMTILKEHAWDRPDSWQPICIAMRLYVSRSLECIPDLNIHRFDDDQVYRQVNDLVNKRNFHCIDHVGWSLGRLCHDWPVQLAEIEVLTLRRNLKVEGRMKKEWIWIRDKEAHCGHFAAQKLIIQNPEFDCIIGVNRHERAQKQTVRVTIHVDWEDNKPITCPGLPEKFHINWKGLMRNIRELVEDSSCQTVEALASLIVEFALEYSLLHDIGVDLKKKDALTLAEEAGVQVWRDSEWLQHLPPQSNGKKMGRRERKRKSEWLSGHYLFG